MNASIPVRLSALPRTLLALGLAIAPIAASRAAADPIADPSPIASPSAPASSNPRPAGRPRGDRLAIATCSRTYFYAWPVHDSAPAVADYPPATNGDAFHVTGDPQVPYSGPVLLETTIDVVEPWGAGKHYWVAEGCVNAS